MRNYVFGLLAAGLWVAVVISMVLVRRSSPGHPFSSIRRFRRGNRALASSTEAAADYEPSLFGSGPWPMESPRDLPETDRPEPAVRSRSGPPPRAQNPPGAEIHAEQTERHEEDVEVIETRKRRRKPREANYVPTLGDRLLAEAEAKAEAEAGERPGEHTGEFPAASQPIAAEAPAAQPKGMTPEWGPSRRGLLRRRKTEDDLLSPAFARQTEEPKLVVKLGKPQDEEPPPRVAPRQRSKAREPKPRLIAVSDRALAAGSPEAPRIITVAFEDEPEEEAPPPAPVWVQRVVPMPPSQVVQMPELPEEIEEEDAEAQGLLASALLRASEAPLEGTPPPRPQPAATAPPGSMPVPLPFIRGIGRTRNRVTVPGGIPPPVVHIQTIHLDDEGDPVIVTEEEAAEAAAREAALLEVTEVETLIELDLPPLGTPATEALEAIEPSDAATGREPSASWEPELPADAPWFHDVGAADEQADQDRPEAFWDDASLDDLPADSEEAAETLVAPAEAAAPSPEPEPEHAESPAQRVARPAPIDVRAGRRAARSTGPESERLRARRLGAHRGGADERDPNSVTLSTGSAVRPRVTVNLTEQDIEDSDELYEVEALLDAITRDPKKKRRGPFRGSQPAPPEPPPMSSHVIRRDRPAGGSTEVPSPAASSAPPSPSPAAPSSFPRGEVPTPPIRRPAPDARPAPRPELRPQNRLDTRPVPRPEFRPQAPSERRPATGAAPVVLPRSAWEERLNARASGASAPGTNGARKPGAREPARQPEPKAAPARRKAARGPVTLILVDDEGRPQSD